MCGIAGGYSKNGLNTQLLQQCTDALLHRGPDAAGYYTSPGNKVFLGHRRLSILDLSVVANQPMYSADERYIIIYNGEVYNFAELRNKLPGHAWKTNGDTEVILELYAHYGAACFEWLNGMFAIAVYDTQTGNIVLARDQMAIKPLFYYWDNSTFIFGSELKVIQQYCTASNITLVKNDEAISNFLHLGFIPSPLTIYHKVFKFPSGHYGTIDAGKNELTLHQYWNAATHFLSSPVANEQDAYTQYKKTLFAAVEGQMISDVPLGTFLSGGIDSSLVTAVASKLSSKKVNTFSIGFKEAKYDESAYAAAVANHLGTEHHPFQVSVNDVLELVPKLLDVYDEPFADSSAFPTMLVSRLARQHVTVALSGDGGDELFQGYGMYTWAARLQKPLLKAFRKPIYSISQKMDNRFKRAGRLFDYPSADRLHTHIFSQEQYFFSEQELQKLLCKPQFDFAKLNKLDIPGKGNAQERQAFWDLKFYLPDDLLVKVDRASMQYSLESRVPLLDINLVQLGLNIEYNLKVKEGFGTKYLMKKVLYEMVPREIFERPKRGFAIPLKEWLAGPLKHLVDDYLNPQVIEQYQVVNARTVSDLVQRFRKGEDHLYNRIWLLIILHWWLDKNK